MQELRSLLEVQEYDVALDWVTFCSIPGHATTSRFRAWSFDVMERRAERFPKKDKAYIKGYSGFAHGGFHLVRRERDGHMQMWAKGEDTETLVEEVLNGHAETKCSRVDIAVTARVTRPRPDYPNGARTHIESERVKAKCKLRTAMALFNDKTSDTGITIGVRGTAKYARIYDYEAKHRKKTTSVVWRHELELRKLASQRFWNEYKMSSNKKPFALSVAYHEFDNWRLPCDWMSDAGKHVVSATAEETTDDKRLLYADSSLLPFLSKLVAAGREEELKVLIKKHGLDNLFKVG